RFIAGESVDQVVPVVRDAADKGLEVTLDVVAGSGPDGGAAGEAGYSCTAQRPSSTSNSPASRIALTVVR
ncbi:hypothetical protein ABZ737_31540, partial [Streptomyces sp. NPDC013087]